MPTTRLPSSTGRPEILWVRVSESHIADGHRRRDGDRILEHAGFEALDLETSAACRRGLKFLCTMPMPPSCANAMARRVSVTVSMAADTSGRFRERLRVRRVFRLTSRGESLSGRVREGRHRMSTPFELHAWPLFRSHKTYYTASLITTR